jgi:hypothetical protein
MSPQRLQAKRHTEPLEIGLSQVRQHIGIDVMAVKHLSILLKSAGT